MCGRGGFRVSWQPNSKALDSLGKWSEPKDEHFTDTAVTTEIAECFRQGRAYPFFPDKTILTELTSEASLSSFRPRLMHIRDNIADQMSTLDRTAKWQFRNNLHLSARILEAMAIVHQILAHLQIEGLSDRRFVLIRERPTSATLVQPSNQSYVLAHVGQGPPHQDLPSIYLGLKLFDLVVLEKRHKGSSCFQALMEIIRIENRAIQTGYAHTDSIGKESTERLDVLLSQLIELTLGFQAQEILLPPKGRSYNAKDRRLLLERLDARMPDEELRFAHQGDREVPLQVLQEAQAFCWPAYFSLLPQIFSPNESSNRSNKLNTYSHVCLEPNVLILSCLKPCNDGRSHIIRFYNPTNKKINSRLIFSKPCAYASQLYLNEEPCEKQNIRTKDNVVMIPCRGKEIITLRISC